MDQIYHFQLNHRMKVIKYIYVVSEHQFTASFPGVDSMIKEYDIYILESNRLEGSWSLVQYFMAILLRI